MGDDPGLGGYFAIPAFLKRGDSLKYGFFKSFLAESSAALGNIYMVIGMAMKNILEKQAD